MEEIRLKVRNIGPLCKGEVHFAPLTLFVGPNSAGKTLFANLLNIFPGKEKPLKINPLISIFARINWEIFYKEALFPLLKKEKGFLKELIENLNIHSAYELSTKGNKRFTKFFKNTLGSIFDKDTVIEALKYYYALSEIGQIITYGRESGSIDATVDLFTIHLNLKKNHTCKYTFNWKIKKIIFNKSHTLEFSTGFNENNLVVTYPTFMDGKTVIEKFLEWIFRRFQRKVLAQNVYSLPAIRSGIMQSYKPLIGAYIKTVPKLKLKWLEIPFLPYTAQDLLSQISMLSSIAPKGDFTKISEEIEKEILHGSVILEEISETLLPEILFRQEGYTLNINRVSSSVSEMIPFLIYLKHVLKKGDILIFDEPESHLHPRNQAILAKYLVKLVNNGLNIVITTHSDFIINKLNNLILEEPSYPFSLSPEKIKVYLFEQRKNNKFTIKKMAISSNGIELEEFQKIREELYDEEIKLFYKKERERRKMQ